MRTVRDIIRRPPVWVNPGHTVETAVVLLRGHGFGGLPVLDGQNLAGFVTYSDLVGADPYTPVKLVMQPGPPPLQPAMNVREAVEAMVRCHCHRMPVMENGRLVAVVTSADLLPEVTRSFDPLTELPWSDSLREWAIVQLQSGREITVLFIDLDRFGLFNKRYGHIIGDDVLKSVAQVLRGQVDEATDFLARYGGDEFCIATVRSADEATELAGAVRRAVAGISLDVAANERITCTVGQAGGKRTREREHVHYAATMNSLINLDSRDCMANKSLAAINGEAPAAAGQPIPRAQILFVDVSRSGQTATVRVDLEMHNLPPAEQPRDASITASADTDEPGAIRMVGQAAAAALNRLLPEGHSLRLSDVLLNTTADEQSLVTAVGQYTSPSYTVPVAGSAVISTDRYRAAAAAVLASVNRLIGRLTAEPETRMAS